MAEEAAEAAAVASGTGHARSYTDDRVRPADHTRPARTLSVVDIVAIVAGTVIGAFIFRAPSMVAGNVSGTGAYIAVWVVGGLVSLIGALCYAELATTYPSAGGEYHYLTRAFGGPTGFLFAWARLSVIQTGSIALQAFIVGDYASAIFPIGGEYSASIYAVAVIALFTALNVAGVRQGSWTQRLLTTCEVLGLFLVIAAGAVVVARFGTVAAPAPAPGAAPSGGGLGMAMVFVLLAYGGWNESSYLSAEVKGGPRTIAWGLMLAIGLVTAVYVLVNVAMVAGLGLPAMAASEAVAADLLRRATGEVGAKVISVIIVIAALSTVNATIFTGARTNFALGRDISIFSALGRWRGGAETPANALLVQGVIAVALVLFGAATNKLSTLVEYTTPVFWLFFLLVGVSLFVLRRRDPEVPRAFRVPLYPLTPILFCAFCIYMLHASLSYNRLGALVGVAVLLAGAPLTLLASRPAQGQLAQQRA